VRDRAQEFTIGSARWKSGSTDAALRRLRALGLAGDPIVDLGYVTVTPDLRVQVNRRLEAEWHNGREYYAHNGEPLRFHPADPARLPSPEFLKWHNESRFQT